MSSVSNMERSAIRSSARMSKRVGKTAKRNDEPGRDECFKSHPRFDGRNYTYDIVADLKNNNMNESIVFNSVLNINLTFRLFSLRLDSLTNGRCLSIQGIISFTNKDNNGQALVDLQTNTSEISCKNINVDLPDVDVRHVTETSILVSVEVFSVISLLAMFSDLLIGVWLCCKTRKYMKQNSERHFPGQTNGFPLKEYIYRIKGWNIFVIIGDIFTLIGTVNIASTNEVNWRLDEYDNYSIYLGVGCLLCWICLARYFHISKKFHSIVGGITVELIQKGRIRQTSKCNIFKLKILMILLFKTTYRAILDALAYLICVFFLFWSFVFCGYVVLGPYHIKSIPMAANTLFSTIIGDEITVTLDGLENDKLGSPYIKWFSQIYLYLFISIFAIVVLNILIAIFTSAYEAIQKEYKKQTKYKKQKENTDPLRKILRELLHTDDNLEDSIGQVRNALFKILEPQDNINMSPRERILRQELEAVVMDHDTSRKPTIKAFMEIGKERLNEPVKCCKVHCIS